MDTLSKGCETDVVSWHPPPPHSTVLVLEESIIVFQRFWIPSSNIVCLLSGKFKVTHMWWVLWLLRGP